VLYACRRHSDFIYGRPVGQAIIFCSCGFFFMAALHSSCGHSILPLWFLLSFFLPYSQPSQIACLPYFHTWCGISANLECRSEMCCTRLGENIGCKNYAKNPHLRTIAQLCRAISSQMRCVSTIRKKLVNQQYLLHKSSQYGECRPTNGWDRCGSLGHSSKFQRVSRLGFVTALTSRSGSQLNFALSLVVSWPASLHSEP